MQKFDPKELKKLYIPPPDSHKGQNGRLMIIGGSHLFHAASIWALEVSSRIVDLVHYSSTPENNTIVMEVKKQFRDGIVIPREQIEEYIKEDDCVLIGPGMVRSEASQATGDRRQGTSLMDIEEIQDEGEQTAALTNYLLAKYPRKQWVIDAGALQMMDIRLIPHNGILTPHKGEFDLLLKKNREFGIVNYGENDLIEVKVKEFSKKLHCIVLLKGEKDIACNVDGECRAIEGGNPGMTKGGTGDVLAGLV
ncbi:NAD(P)H-hydrate dehydratase, partial [Patescibacteria group bacterium]|nr:NAD(P)H-hydrate dehydratase [Patescibacteria group bacterium]